MVVEERCVVKSLVMGAKKKFLATNYPIEFYDHYYHQIKSIAKCKQNKSFQ